MNYKMDFISGDTKKCLLAVSLPMMVAMFLNMAYNLVDSLWIGNLMGGNRLCCAYQLYAIDPDPKFHSDGSYQWNFNPFVASSRCQR